MRIDRGSFRLDHDALRIDHGDLRIERGDLRMHRGDLRLDHGDLRCEAFLFYIWGDERVLINIKHMTEIEEKINALLAKWDLVGSYHVDPRWPFVEYQDYILPIINSYIETKDVYEYLKEMFLSMLGEHTNEDLKEIREYADEINKILQET